MVLNYDGFPPVLFILVVLKKGLLSYTLEQFPKDIQGARHSPIVSPLCIDNLRLPPSPYHLSPPSPPRQIIPNTATWDKQYIVTQEYVIIPDIDT